MDPNLAEETFRGSVEIDVDVVESTTTVVLNSEDLTILAASVDGQPCQFELDPETQRITLTTNLEVGPAVVALEFEGAFNENLIGFYLSRFPSQDTDTAGGATEAKLATTQFEATHARKAFPCWDEPSLKATFDIELVVTEGNDAIANSAELSRTDHPDGGVLVKFATTMVMSTYLVAFVVGPIEATEAVDVNGVPLRVVYVAGRDPALAEYALDVGAHALTYFTDYFDIGYPGDKVDLVAIPDFAFGAMENLGCITFREALLLIDPTAATQPELQQAADVINHELAHMWFGDLVTMKWWNGLWLNEAFATFMEMRCTDAYKPEWQRWVDFGISRSAAFDTDAMAATRPIEFQVTSPEEAEGMFDVLTYEKGAAVVRMLEQYLGEEQFRSGIRRYIKQHAYGNAETTDLWDAIEEELSSAGHQAPVRRLMDSWIFQGGFPQIFVELAQNGHSFTLTQERFGLAGGDPAPNQQWIVPVRYRWKSADGTVQTGQVLLEEETTEVQLDNQASWLVVNAEGASFVRVAYPPEALADLAAISLEELLAVERYALIDDAWAAVLADQISAASFLSTLEMLTGEEDRSVWQRIIVGFGSLDRLLDDDGRVQFQGLVHDALAPALAGLTLSPQADDTDRSRQLRGDLIRAMGTLANDLEIQHEAQRTVAEGRRDPQLVEASIMAAALDVVASIGDEADFNDYLMSFREVTNPQEQLRYLYAMADFPDDALLSRVRQMILDGEVRSQNAPFWLRRSLLQRANGRSSWEFIQQNWDQLTELLASSAVVRMIEGIAVLTDPGEPEAAAAFFAANPLPQSAQTLAQILERQRVNAALHQREASRFQSIISA